MLLHSLDTEFGPTELDWEVWPTYVLQMGQVDSTMYTSPPLLPALSLTHLCFRESQRCPV